MGIMVEPEVGVKKPPDLKTVDLKTRTKAAANTAKELENEGLNLEPTAEDKDVAAKLSTSYAENPEETSKKVTVEVKSQSKPKLQESKNTVHILSQPTLTEKEHILNLLKMLIKEDINIKNLTIKKNKLNNIVAEYIQENPITEKQRTPVIEKVIKVLEKRK